MMCSAGKTRVQRRGVALALVLAFIAVASVMALSLLSSTSLQAESSANGSMAIGAQYCAESGMETAIYYLNYPSRAPTVNSQGFWAGGTGLVVGTQYDSADVTITSEGTDKYLIVSTGYSGTSTSNRVSRTIRAHVQLTMKYLITKAFAANKAFTAPAAMKVNGDARSDGSFTLKPGAEVTGTIYSLAPKYTNWAAVPSGKVTAAPSDYSEITIMSTMSQAVPTYTYNGQTYQASAIPVIVPANPVANVLTNPANVWYADIPLTLSSFDLQGTLIVRNLVSSPLTVTGACRIRPKEGMPGLVIPGDLVITSLVSSSLRVDGLVWMGGNIKSAALIGTGGGDIDVRGAMLWGGNTAKVTSNYTGTIRTDYVPENIKIDNFANTGLTPVGSKILSWGR